MATLKNTTINDTGYLTMPIGTTGQQPASPQGGMLRFNSTTGTPEYYSSTTNQWLQFGSVTITISYLIAAGGGGGGGSAGDGWNAGGGGAGGYLT
jgi:hypothetical protein